MRKLRNIGVKVLVIYAVTSAVSTLIGFFVATLIDPGKGFDMGALGEVAYEAKEMPSVLDTIIDMFPTNIFQSFTSMGCPGVPGGAIIMTTILLTNMGLPLEIVGLIAGIFRIIDMADTTFNVTGDVVSTLCVARSEKMFTKEPGKAI